MHRSDLGLDNGISHGRLPRGTTEFELVVMSEMGTIRTLRHVRYPSLSVNSGHRANRLASSDSLCPCYSLIRGRLPRWGLVQ